MPTYIDTVLKEFDAKTNWEEWEVAPEGHLLKTSTNGDLVWFPESEYEVDNEKIKTFLKSSLEHFAQMVEKEHAKLTSELGANEYRSGMDFMAGRIISLLKEETNGK